MLVNLRQNSLYWLGDTDCATFHKDFRERPDILYSIFFEIASNIFIGNLLETVDSLCVQSDFALETIHTCCL